MNTPQASPDLASLRVQIDTIDQQLLSLLNQRALVAEQVGTLQPALATAWPPPVSWHRAWSPHPCWPVVRLPLVSAVPQYKQADHS